MERSAPESPALPFFLLLVQLKILNFHLIKRLPSGSRGEETVNNKTQTKSKTFLFLFLSKKKMEFRTYFVYFHTFSYKFKVQRTPTEFGLTVVYKMSDRPEVNAVQ